MELYSVLYVETLRELSNKFLCYLERFNLPTGTSRSVLGMKRNWCFPCNFITSDLIALIEFAEKKS